jgi:tRNA (guanine-N7-)-methyltransferase
VPIARSDTTRPDGDRVIRSYTRRGSRLNTRQHDAWEQHAAAWLIDPDLQITPGFDLRGAFERTAPLAVEIGCGIGEALLPLAVAHPDWNVLGFEVWQPGVGECLARIAGSESTNIRLSALDAVWCLEHGLEPESITELWTFFPDPWPKVRHHKRRLINPEFAALVASRLIPGGVWRLATDWPHYAGHMRGVLDDVPQLSGGVTERYDGRPLTRFERRGIAAGRPVTDLAYRRTSRSMRSIRPPS